jgi:hypothetical protein
MGFVEQLSRGPPRTFLGWLMGCVIVLFFADESATDSPLSYPKRMRFDIYL